MLSSHTILELIVSDKRSLVLMIVVIAVVGAFAYWGVAWLLPSSVPSSNTPTNNRPNNNNIKPTTTASPFSLTFDPRKPYVLDTNITQRIGGTIEMVDANSLKLKTGADSVTVQLVQGVEVVRRVGAQMEKNVKLEKGQKVEIVGGYKPGEQFVGQTVMVVSP